MYGLYSNMNSVTRLLLLMLALCVPLTAHAAKEDALHERAFEQDIRIEDGEKNKIEINLAAAGQSQENERLHAPADAAQPILPAVKEHGVAPGKSFKDCNDCPEMVVIPPGSFMLGKPGSQQQINIAQPFAAGQYEVTFAEWDACVIGGGCSGYHPSDEGWGRSKRPVMNVSWNEAQQYVQWLSQQTGKTYRLLTEAEWEYAASAGGAAESSWRNVLGKGKCAGCDKQIKYKQTAPVGSFQANAFGLYDMYGNVFEWVEDCHNGNCAEHILRGGSWYLGGDRIWGERANRCFYRGFRIARMMS